MGRCVRVHLCPSRCNPMGFLMRRRSLPFTTSPGGRHHACHSRQQGVCCRRQEAAHTCCYQHVTGAESCWLCRDRIWVSSMSNNTSPVHVARFVVFVVVVFAFAVALRFSCGVLDLSFAFCQVWIGSRLSDVVARATAVMRPCRCPWVLTCHFLRTA